MRRWCYSSRVIEIPAESREPRVETFGPMEQEPMFLSRYAFPGCFWENFLTKCGVRGILDEAA
jgi:hypothetical protein